MKNLKCQIYGFLSLYILFMKSRTSLENLFDYDAAEEKCKTHGGLESNNEFRENNGFLMVNSEQMRMLNLQDGESAWISGYAEYLKFLSWFGCYEIKLPLYSKNVESTFANCFDFCDSYFNEDITFVGLRNGYCYCIKTEQMTKTYLEIVDNSQCSQFNPYNFKCNECTSGKATSVFRIHKHLRFDQNLPALKQCVSAKSISTSFYYKVSSCYKAQEDGFLCINDGVSKLDSTCDGFHAPDATSSAFCIQHKFTDWIQAREYCSNCSGRLVAELLPAMAGEMNNSLQYWTGIFQSFKFANQTSRVDNVPTPCLAVRRIHEKLVLDPDDCFKQKKYLCSDWKDINPSLTTSTLSINDVPIITKKPEKENMKNDVIYVVVALLAVFVLGIIIFILIKCSNRNKGLQETVSNFGGNDECIENTTASYDGTYENAQASQINRTKNVKPVKPLRHTLKIQNVDRFYENFKLKSNDIEESGVQANTENEDVDTLDLKSTGTSCLNKSNTDVSHCYDPTTASDFESTII